MAEIVTMPKLGFDMAEGLLVRWAVAVGEEVEKGQLLAEIETDKATVEVESPYTGTVLKHLVGEDAIVPINEPIAVIGEPGEDVDDIKAAPAEAPAEPEADAAVAKPETEEAADEPETDAAVAKPETEEAADKPEAEATETGETGGQLPDGVRASPLARNMAESNAIDLKAIRGSGPQGRIVKKDVEKVLEKAPETAKISPAPAPKFVETTREDRTVELTRLRKAIGRRMTESKQQYPHFYVTYDYDVDSLMEMRTRINDRLSADGIKISVNDIIVKGTAMALRHYPNLNASLGDGVAVQHGHINVGVAVAVEGGLLTVVCHDADMKSLSQISVEVREKAGRVRSGKVQPDDISGSTFTTSNLGMFGVDEFTAIISPPEAAILALGAARQVPVVRDGQLAIGWRMKATISVDHRVSDGAEAAAFMRKLADYLETPYMMLV